MLLNVSYIVFAETSDHSLVDDLVSEGADSHRRQPEHLRPSVVVVLVLAIGTGALNFCVCYDKVFFGRFSYD